MWKRVIKYFIENKLISISLLIGLVLWGVVVSPFEWDTGWLPRDPLAVDAIPDLGENQQIVTVEWPGRSPQDVEDQITYPLVSALLGVPGVKTIRSSSIFGLSIIYIIFEEDVEFYWSRSRVLEKLASLPPNLLPPDVRPALGPDATALGQIFWYTLEGRDPKTGEPVGGWDPHELRTIQDFYVRYYLTAVPGVAEVSSVGGFVKEYQIDLDPEALKTYNITLQQVLKAVKESNLDIGAATMEINKAEYFIRSLGYVKRLEDLKNTVVAYRDGTPIYLDQIATITFGPAPRRGGLDKEGVEAVGGVVVARYGANPMEVLKHLKRKIQEIAPSLPEKVLPDGRISKVTIVPFYDRTQLIRETIATLEHALEHEVLISMLVVLLLVMNLKASLLISSSLPIGVLLSFIVLKLTGITANVVALSGIAIAIGVMVDIGIVFVENVVRHIEERQKKDPEIEYRYNELGKVVYEAIVEVAPALFTALATTIVSFLPVFTLEAAEGKLFRPLAYAKTYALIASLIAGVLFIPPLAHWVFFRRRMRPWVRLLQHIAIMLIWIGSAIYFKAPWLSAIAIVNLAAIFSEHWKIIPPKWARRIAFATILLIVLYLLTHSWLPLGPQNPFIYNFLFVAGLVALILTPLMLMVRYYEYALKWCLSHRKTFFILPLFTVFLGFVIWLGWERLFGFLPSFIKETRVYEWLAKKFPGLGEEFMPPLDEGAFLYMPTTMSHSGVEFNLEVIRKIDKAVAAIPEVELVVGKWGRVNSALDPAPIFMFENIIQYRPEYILDSLGRRMRFKVNDDGAYVLIDGSTYHPEKDGFRIIPKDSLIPDDNGQYFRQWRPHIRTPDDIWKEIVKRAQHPGLTTAPKLQPIQTRLIMLQTGMRASMGMKIFGPDLKTIEQFGLEIEKALKKVEGVEPASVFADRLVGKPYLIIDLKRRELARYGLTVVEVQRYLSTALGGVPLTTSVEGRERFPIRVRYARDYRETPEALKQFLIPTPQGIYVPLGQLADIRYEPGPQNIKSEDGFLVGYVVFDKKPGYAEVEVVRNAQKYLQHLIENGQLKIPKGVHYRFTGNYENQLRAAKRLAIIIPLSLIIVFLIIYLQFGTITASMIHFSGVFVALSGGFLIIWLYGQPWFMNFEIAGVPIRTLFQMGTVHLSVAVWVGFLSLFGIATDDGVIMGTYIHQVFDERHPKTKEEIQEAILTAGKRRVRPAMMTAACAIIALLPVLTSQGKGSEVMMPIALPTFGGMLIQIMTMFVVPVLFAVWKESQLKRTANNQ